VGRGAGRGGAALGGGGAGGGGGRGPARPGLIVAGRDRLARRHCSRWALSATTLLHNGNHSSAARRWRQQCWPGADRARRIHSCLGGAIPWSRERRDWAPRCCVLTSAALAITRWRTYASQRALALTRCWSPFHKALTASRASYNRGTECGGRGGRTARIIKAAARSRARRARMITNLTVGDAGDEVSVDTTRAHVGLSQRMTTDASSSWRADSESAVTRSADFQGRAVRRGGSG